MPRHDRRLPNPPRGPRRGRHRNRFHPPRRMRAAVRRQRAAAADRSRGRADRRAEVHQGLVERSRAAARHERRGDPPDRLVAGAAHGLGVAAEPCQHPPRVGLDDRRRQIERDRGDRPGRVPPHPGKRPQSGDRPRKHAAVLGHERLGRGVQLPGPPIIAQPLPMLEDLRFARPREMADAGEPAEEPGEEILDAFDLCLLEHHLAHPHGIGITGAAPRQVAPRPGVPPREPPPDAGRIGDARRGGRAEGRTFFNGGPRP